MAEGAMKYHVVVTRDGDGWMADVPALPGTHTWAKTLRALDRNVREVIGMVEDLPRSAEAALDLEMDYHTGDPVLDERAGRLRALRRSAGQSASAADRTGTDG
jgi:predicted RNase H-like HicB family nuclease